MAEVKIRSSLDSRGFQVGMTRMKGEVKGFASQLNNMKGMIAGAFSAGALISLGRSAVRMGSQISDLATQTGLTTDELQALEVAALKAGTPVEKIRTAFSKVSVVLGQAKRGMKTYIDLFAELGISQEQLAQLNTADAFELISQKIANATEGSREYGAALEILGTRSGAQLIEVLREIADVGLQGMVDKAKEAGDIIDADLIQRLDTLEDKLQLTGRRIKTGVGEALDWLGTKVSEAAEFWGTLAGGGTVSEAAAAMGADARSRTAAREKQEKDKAKREEIRKEEEVEAQRLRMVEKRNKEAARENEDFNRQQLALLEKEEKAADRVVKKREGAAKKLAAIQDRMKISAEATDRLSRIGGRIGGQLSPEMQIERAQLQIMKEQKSIMDNLAKEIGNEVAELGTLA